VDNSACLYLFGGLSFESFIYIQGSWWSSIIKLTDTIDLERYSIFVSSSPSGWSKNDIGLAWLKEVFERETRVKARSGYRLLFLNGHGSHVTMGVINHCHDNKNLSKYSYKKLKGLS
jgi:hypothetical protein